MPALWSVSMIRSLFPFLQCNVTKVVNYFYSTTDLCRIALRPEYLSEHGKLMYKIEGFLASMCDIKDIILFYLVFLHSGIFEEFFNEYNNVVTPS